VTGDPAEWTRVSGRRLSSLSDSLRRMPATVQERWFGRLWLLKPVVLATLSAFWIASGLIALVRFDAAASILTTRGVGVPAAELSVALGILLDLALGLAILVRRSMPWGALGMIATSAVYLLAGSALAPELWADPLGPYVKTVPGAVLALVALALAEER
jgi:hypothetical protein